MREMKVKDVMTKKVRWTELPGSRAEALETMKELKASALPVVRRGTEELVGLVTLQKLFENPDEDQLAMLVDRDIPTVNQDENLKVAAELFLKHKVRRLPVVKDGKLTGIITVKDIVHRTIAEGEINRPAADFMRPHIIGVWEGTPLPAVLQLIRLSGFRVLPVIDEKGKLSGTISDMDLVKLSDIEVGSQMSQMTGRSEGDRWSWDTEARIYVTKKELTVPDKPVKDVITKDVVTISKRTTVSKAAQLMKQHDVGQVLVLNAEGKLIGTVRDIDLLRVVIW
jgi:CBS domain-containing protein